MVDEFEDGKQIEEYLDPDPDELKKELDSIPLTVENEQTFETVAEEPVRNKKEKKQELPPKPIEPTQPQQTEPQQPTTQTSPEQPQPTPQPPTYTGIDDYIMQTANQIGEITKKQFIENSYRNLFAVINGEVQLTPIQQPQQQTPPPKTEEPKLDLTEQLIQIDNLLKDPALPEVTKQALIKKKCLLLDVPYTPEQTKPTPQQTQTKKTKGWSLKMAGAFAALISIVAVGVILLLGLLLA